MRRFIFRTLFALLPVIIFIGAYIVLDPFKVIYRYDEIPSPGDSIVLGDNAGFRSIKHFERNLKAGRHYDSFIFGSSMSQTFLADEWAKHLPHGVSIFHLDASEETVQGIVDKLDYLANHGVTPSHALIVMEEAMLHRDPNNQSFLFMRPPSITRDVNWLQFHLSFFEVFKNPTFIGYCFMPSRYTSTMLKERYASHAEQVLIDSINENRYARIDSILAVNPDEYYTPQRVKAIDYHQPPQPRQAMPPSVKKAVAELADRLHRVGVDYQVIVPPRYERHVLQPHDRAILDHYLGKERIHDFSRHGFSHDVRAYYDFASHLTTAKSTIILHEAYNQHFN